MLEFFVISFIAIATSKRNKRRPKGDYRVR